MKIEMLDKRTILVSMKEDDMRRYSLSFDDSVPQAQLKDLLVYVGEVCGLDHCGKSYLIEALPSRTGCLLIISVRAVKRKKIYRIKRRSTREICVFFHADAMLDFIRFGMRSGYSIYRYNEKYILFPGLTTDGGELAQLSEYGELYPVSAAAEARIREYGALLRQQDAQRRHISGGTVAVCNAALRNSGG